MNNLNDIERQVREAFIKRPKSANSLGKNPPRGNKHKARKYKKRPI